MTRFVALLRGINVGGANVLPMEQFRALAEGLGWADVETYIQSGNLVFSAEGEPGDLATALGTAMAEKAGFVVPILVLPGWAFEMAVEECPFTPDDPAKVYGFFLFAEGEIDGDLFDNLKAPDEELALQGRVAWLHAPSGIGRSRVAERMQRIVGAGNTARNFRTLQKLVEML